MTISCSIVSILLAAADPGPSIAPDKSGYHLGNPTPREFMRPLSADRPDTTESPYTVDAGHLQIEMSFLEWTRDDRPRTDSWDLAPINIKLGLTNATELQLVVAPWVLVDPKSGPRTDGPGDIAVRLKHNLWGNDGGDTALALMPFITIPTGADGISSNRVEGGLIVPLAIELPAGFSLGLMAELDLVWNDDDDAYDLDFVHSAALGRDLIGNLAGFIEYVGVVGSDPDTAYRASVNLGLTLGVTPDLQLDGGIGLGLTEDADDLRLFTGLTIRF